MDFSHVLGRMRENWKSGVTVALVSVPLSISLGIAAGATPLMGIITAVWAGAFAALFGGSAYNIVGPTGALSGILAAYVLTHGVEYLPGLAILTGLLTLMAYALRWERYVVFVPAPVIHGFTLGVAFIIGLNQLNFALGLTGLESHPEFLDNVLESLRHAPDFSPQTFLLFFVGLIFLLGMVRKFPKAPGAIVLALLGLPVGFAASKGLFDFELLTIASRYGEIPASIYAKTGFPRLSFDTETLFVAGAVALVAILETLISAKIADGMTKTRADQRKELFGLALANIASGAMGGIPATAALARTSLNVKSGATSADSGRVSAATVALIALACLPYFQYVPLAIVASILVYVAIRMVEIEQFKHLYVHDRGAFMLSIAVAVVTIARDPIIGILVGSLVALLMFAKKLSVAQGEITINKDGKMLGRCQPCDLSSTEDHGDVLVYRFAGELTYINAQSHHASISQIKPETKVVVLSFRNLFYVDVDGLDSVAEIIDHLRDSGRTIRVSGIHARVLPLFQHTDWFPVLEKSGAVYPTSLSAVQAGV